MIFTILLAFVALILLYNVYARFNRTGRLIDKIPGPPAYPIFGNILQMQGNHEMLFKLIRKTNEEYYPISRFWSITLPIVNILHPDDLEVILTSKKHIDKSVVYKYLEDWLSTGLLTSSGVKWQNRRKILTSAFHFTILTHFVDILIDESQYLVKSLKKMSEGGPVVTDVMNFIGEHTLNAICETAMGISLKGKDNKPREYQNAIKVAGQSVTYRFVRPWYYYNFIFKFTSFGRTQTRALKILHDFTESIIAERKRYHENTARKYLQNFDEIHEKSGGENDGDVSVRKRRLAMLDLLIAASLKNEVDDKGIREEVDTFTFEGHDTTTVALSFALLLFAKNKEVQERIREEVDAVMLADNYKLTISVLQQFTYTERCLKEVLRLYPTVPLISRKIKQDCALKNYIIPAGATVNMHIYDVHRNPEFWPNPLVFDPDRFLPENVKGRHPFSYIPFSAGPRNCIGQKFAMLEMKLMVAYILHNFALEPVDELDDVQMIADLVLRPSHPIRMKFIPLR